MESADIIPFHHTENDMFRNPKGSPELNPDKKFSYSTFYKEKRKIKFNIPKNHVIDRNKVLGNKTNCPGPACISKVPILYSELSDIYGYRFAC